MSAAEKVGVLVIAFLFSMVWVHIWADIVAPTRRTKLREPQWWYWDGEEWHYVKHHEHGVSE